MLLCTSCVNEKCIFLFVFLICRYYSGGDGPDSRDELKTPSEESFNQEERQKSERSGAQYVEGFKKTATDQLDL